MLVMTWEKTIHALFPLIRCTGQEPLFPSFLFFSFLFYFCVRVSVSVSVSAQSRMQFDRYRHANTPMQAFMVQKFACEAIPSHPMYEKRVSEKNKTKKLIFAAQYTSKKHTCFLVWPCYFAPCTISWYLVLDTSFLVSNQHNTRKTQLPLISFSWELAFLLLLFLQRWFLLTRTRAGLGLLKKTDGSIYFKTLRDVVLNEKRPLLQIFFTLSLSLFCFQHMLNIRSWYMFPVVEMSDHGKHVH